jgi:RimJ/RimL family protein N-acetyltransferase
MRNARATQAADQESELADKATHHSRDCSRTSSIIEEKPNIQIIDAKQEALKEKDIRSIVEIECDPKVREWLYEYVLLDFEKEFKSYIQFFRKLPQNRKADILLAKCDGIVVGFLGLWRLDAYMQHVATIGVSVDPCYWGKGVGTALVRSAINLAKRKEYKRLEIETLAENASMRQLAVRAGFKLESLRKNRVMRNGSYFDEVAYSLLL